MIGYVRKSLEVLKPVGECLYWCGARQWKKPRQAAWSVFRLAVSRGALGESVVAGVLCRWICMDVFFPFLSSLVRDMLDWLRAGRFVTEL